MNLPTFINTYLWSTPKVQFLCSNFTSLPKISVMQLYDYSLASDPMQLTITSIMS